MTSASPSRSNARSRQAGGSSRREPSLIAPGARAGDHGLVDVGGDDLDARLGKRRLGPARPGDAQAVRFLARRAAGAPASHRPVGACDSARGEPGKRRLGQPFEDGPVAPEARDRDAAQLVEPVPLASIVSKIAPVGLDILELQLAHAPRHALAHRAAHPSEPLPTQSHPRQAPLQKGDTVAVAHWPPFSLRE